MGFIAMIEIKSNGKPVGESVNKAPSADDGASSTAQFIREEAEWLLSIAEKNNLQNLSDSLKRVILQAASVD